MAVTPTSGRRGLPIALLLLLLPAFLQVDLARSQDPLPDGFLESNHVWSGSFDSAMFGSSVADAGDVNGDGFSDIVVGAYGWDIPGGLFDEGAAFVFLGGPDGIVGTDPTTANAVLLGDQAGTEFGWSVAGAGDVNGDGFDDIIVGAHHYDSTIAGGTLAVDGAAFVFLGSPTGIDATGPSTAHASIFGTVLDSRLGHAVSAAGDVNNDGFGDIIVGMPRMGIPFACTQTNPPTCSIPENDYQGNGGAALIFLGSA
ncbi:MAG: integrin alpha, partial [Planctomycetota bacterium]|nr:integrin alpha [Planctomycetota bacterium]